MLRHLTPVGVAAVLCASSLSPVAARAAQHGHARVRVPTVAVTFHLQVFGTPEADTTFWVAHGPLAGQFGLIQLKELRPGVYGATERLPTGGRTIFAYLEGQGTAHTRFGVAPGDPVVTIKVMGPLTVTARSLPAVHWQLPAG